MYSINTRFVIHTNTKYIQPFFSAPVTSTTSWHNSTVRASPHYPAHRAHSPAWQRDKMENKDSFKSTQSSVDFKFKHSSLKTCSFCFKWASAQGVPFSFSSLESFLLPHLALQWIGGSLLLQKWAPFFSHLPKFLCLTPCSPQFLWEGV